ncbi:hypothetical protein ACLD19_22880, partial [Salmonella sp. 741265085_HSA]|uniref:hypothetical protein n=1 Tax=Salmonella sp. 741265085_HSA TaxID=3389063 RepID=UPI003980B964
LVITRRRPSLITGTLAVVEDNELAHSEYRRITTYFKHNFLRNREVTITQSNNTPSVQRIIDFRNPNNHL